jgi:hypothetical protein
VQHVAQKRASRRARKGAKYRTSVLTSVRTWTSRPHSYQLFERCARCLNTQSKVIERGRIADVLEHRLLLIGADIAQR